MDLKNKTELELHFADHFDTLLFPVLADIYYQEGDYTRGGKVCEIGLDYHPDNVAGLFVLARIAAAQGELQKAEKSLKYIVSSESAHFQAALLLAEVQTQLKRSPNTISAAWKKVLSIDPVNAQALKHLNDDKPGKKSGTTVSRPKGSKTKKATLKPITNETLESLSISSRMATFTLLAVLKNQGLYYQALEVLDILEMKGDDPKRIIEERAAIREYLQINESNRE